MSAGPLRFGYAGQNLTLGATTGRTLRLANLQDAEKVRSLVRGNLADLETIIRWNARHGIGLFRMSQQIIPFASHPAFPYDWEREHGDEIRRAGALALNEGIRLSVHPGQFIQPGSPKPAVAQSSLAELRYVARLLSLLRGPGAVMVLHMGGAYGDKRAAASAFVAALQGEAEVLRYLALENDERLWTVEGVVPVAKQLGVPAIVDAFHHSLNGGTLTLAEAIDLALPTWPGRPKLHLSSQNPAKQPGAHAETVTTADVHTLVDALGGRDADIMVEAKGKERAVQLIQSEILLSATS